MKAARVLLAISAVAVALTVIRQVVLEEIGTEAIDVAVIVVGAGLAVSFGGLMLWQSRPQGSTGPLLTVAGFAVLLSSFAGLQPVQLDIVGSLVWVCFPLVVGHTLLAYPDGLPRRRRTAVVVSCWLVPAVFGVPLLLVANSWEPARLVPYVSSSFRGLSLTVSDRPAVARWFAILYCSWIAVVSVVASGTALIRAHRSSLALRPTVVPVAWAGVGWALATLGAIPFSVQSVSDLGSVKMYELMGVVALVMPAVTTGLVAGAIVWADVLRPRLDPTRGGRIVLSGAPLPVAEVLRRRLAKLVGDPSLRLAIAGPDGQWLAPNGRRLVLRDDNERATATLTRDGQVIAAVEYDHALRLAPDLVVVATTMAGLAIDNVRLAALDAAQIEEMRNSGAALLAAAERARQQLAATIAEGPAARMEELAVSAARFEDGLGLQRALRDIAVEVRTISHGVYPPELEKGGLAAALDDASSVPSRRYPPAVELTAYLVATGKPGARLLQENSNLVITIEGTISEHAGARVAALDGTIAVAGDVTTVIIPVPD